jgi:hypothetical protein
MGRHYKNTKADNIQPVVIDFGTRAVCTQNFSKLVALPKPALANLGNNVERVNVELVQEKDSKFIRLTPTQDKEKGERRN